MKRLVKFTKKFATKKKGDEEAYNTMLASQLVRGDKVAIYIDAPKK